jgi:phage shock protein PspC (stress-responsive transcriptional regulator)
MTTESIFQEIKLALNGRPGQALVLGVCKALAVRMKQEVWLVRLVTIVLGMFWTLPVLSAYIVLDSCFMRRNNAPAGFSPLGILRAKPRQWFAAWAACSVPAPPQATEHELLKGQSL